MPDHRILSSFRIQPGGSQPTIQPDRATATKGHGQWHRSEGSRTRVTSSQHQQGGSQRKAESQTSRTGDGCAERESACVMKTTSEKQKLIPRATKRLTKETGIWIQGFDWERQVYDGWQCAGEIYLLFDDQAAADRFIQA